MSGVAITLRLQRLAQVFAVGVFTDSVMRLNNAKRPDRSDPARASVLAQPACRGRAEIRHRNRKLAHPGRRINRGVPVTDYTIAAIPTVYRGRCYRSRLEARWAAYFDLLEMPRVEYEPFDLGLWSPDFSIGGLLVDVKPFEGLDLDSWDKMSAAARRLGWPMIWLTSPAPRLIGQLVDVGWIGNAPSYQPESACLIWLRQISRPILEPCVWDESLLRSFIDGGPERDDYDTTPLLYPDYAMTLWAEASNRVQWQPEARL